MPITRESPIVEKGFIKSVFESIERHHSERRGLFLISFDYVCEKGTSKEILSNKFITSTCNLIETLEGLSGSFGNFHLNYVIDTGILQLLSSDTRELAKLCDEYYRFLTRNNQQSGTKTRPGFIRQEFIMLMNRFKKEEKSEIIFVNENVYRDFIAVVG